FDLRMRLDFLLNAFDVNEVKYAPSAHAEYRVNNTLSLDAEAQIEWLQGATPQTSTNWYSTNLGVRYTF
ncbi:MAG: hypothetical protein OEW08_09075, partial [Gammaproteobacteria bacterium]|nr:hypothetical protein [Gammaproteobacteria bacterium]